jgi:hypothetical protein
MIDFELILDRVAAVLEWLSPPPVYIGGAVVPLFLDDFGRSQMRPTKDVDCIVPMIVSHIEYTRLEEKLRAHGWTPDPKGPICRYLGPDDLVVDFMPERPEVLGFAGKWYSETAKSASLRKLFTGREIFVPCVSQLFACKLEAFFDRGIGDPSVSTDLEDIAALLDGCEELEARTRETPSQLRAYIRSKLDQIANDEALSGALEAQLPRGGNEDARIQKIRKKVTRLINSD